MRAYDIAKNLLEFSQCLLGLGETIATHRREERERLAMYLDKIASTVETIRHSLEKEDRPVSACAELDEYVLTLAHVLTPTLPKEAARFEQALTRGSLARGLLMIVRDAGSQEIAFNDLDEAAGRFRALANRLRM